MRKLAIVASILVVAASSVNCANSSEQSTANILAPSASAAALVGAEGKGGGGKGPANGSNNSTFTYAMSHDVNGNGLPNWGDGVTFNVSTTDTTDPQVSLSCSQNGVLVYAALWPLTPVLTLSSQNWQSGAADCTAKLSYISGTKVVDLTSISFTANE